ncbi:class I adenylate-forming enzyme family protein [Yinghuangia seranimata]|uniref:class I adenylate-forming enzyme family protein n=1 Tax=Yinghuangia seranimata TaxID=408067 RepID=UPI00248BA6F5|nr:class I adenylate-forming enzyme family protein [Yinghuangia seranimata]MDI2126064.1 class I adenylate-forming enzyme family protein [Yinghuangia seranimata]
MATSTPATDPLAALTAPGARFELAEEDVLGVRMRVLAARPTSLSAFVAASAAHGDREYVVHDDGTRLTYAEHARAVASVAAALRERYGVRPGDRVAILAANRPEWLIAFWASVSLGAIAVGMNGWWAGEEIRYGIADCEPKVLIADRRRLERVADADLGVPVVEIETGFADLVRYAPDAALPDGPGDEDDAALILYTSGTTGRPKGAVLTHRNVIAMQNVQALLAARATAHLPVNAVAGRPGRWLVNSPFFHVSGLLAGAVAALADGHTMVLFSGRFDVPAVLATIERERCTNWSVVPTVGWRVVNHPDAGRYDLSSVTRLGGGSAAFAPELVARLQQVFTNAKGAMGVGYGLTESGGVATSAGAAQLEATPGAIGAAVPTVQVEIHGEDGARLADGEEGEIWIRSPLVMLEYWRNPAATEKSLTPDRWLRTGDLGLARGGQFFMATRRSDLILRGGENVYPAEIEHCLDAHPDIAESVVVGVPHPELGEEVKAIVVPKSGGALDPRGLSAYVGDRLAYYKVPSHWEIRTEPLPRTPTGKVIRAVATGVRGADLVEE